MGGSVLTNTYRIMGEKIDDRDFHQGTQPDGWTGIITKDQEGGPKGAYLRQG